MVWIIYGFDRLQFFSVMFFFMLFVLGIGSNIAMCSCIVTAIRDQFPRVKAWQAVLIVAVVGFSIGLFYVTPVNICLYFFVLCWVTNK